MGDINQGRYDRLLRRTTAQVGPGSKVANALEDLFPVLDVERAPIELLRASGWFFASRSLSVTPAAGTVASIQLFNPVGSSRLMVLEYCGVRLVGAGAINEGPSFTALISTVAVGLQRDLRETVLSQTVGELQEEDDAALVVSGQVFLPAANTVDISSGRDYVVLGPGTGWLIKPAAVTVALSIHFRWRERVAEGEELEF